MTEFETTKQRIWDYARANKRDLFDKKCEVLMEKVAQDIWRIGWEICPKDIDEIYTMLDNAAQECHRRWLKAMEAGDAPPEDVSPGEGFAMVKKVIQEAIENAKKSK